MSGARKLFRGTVLLTAGHAASYALSFVRNIILARLLTKADFGLAAVFSMTVSLLEIAGRMSFGQQIIQSRQGDTRRFMDTSHLFQFLLSVGGAFLTVVLSYPLACAFHVPHLAGLFALLAAVPLARSVEHLDPYRQQREWNYVPAVLRELVPQAIVTLAAWPLAKWLGDFRAVVWIMIGKAALGILLTHLLARTPYRWAWQADQVRLLWNFGWPLLLNGLLMFAAQQADQVVVGSFLSLDKLALYALALSVTSIPWFIFGQVGTSVLLPVLARVQDNPAEFRRQYRAGVAYVGIGAVLCTVPLIVAGEPLITLLFGAKYQGAGLLMAILGATTAVRFLRFAPSVAAMARADTLNELYTHLWRSVSLPLAAAVAALGGSMYGIAFCGLGAEIVATTYSLLRLRRRQQVPLLDSARVTGYLVVCLIGAGTAVLAGAPALEMAWAAALLLVSLLIALLLAWALFPQALRALLSRHTPGESV